VKNVSVAEKIEPSTIRTIEKNKWFRPKDRGHFFVQEVLEFKPIKRTIKVVVDYNRVALYEVNLDYIQFYKIDGLTFITTTKEPATKYEQLRVPALPNVKVDGTLCLSIHSNKLIEEATGFWLTRFVAYEHHWPTYVRISGNKPDRFFSYNSQNIEKTLNSSFIPDYATHYSLENYKLIYNV
jgi:hypothetical protein